MQVCDTVQLLIHFHKAVACVAWMQFCDLRAGAPLLRNLLGALKFSQISHSRSTAGHAIS